MARWRAYSTLTWFIFVAFAVAGFLGLVGITTLVASAGR